VATHEEGRPVSRALVLSGGGFRATLYHLGVIEYLSRAGHLADISHVVGVSGGSLAAAHLVLRHVSYCSGPDTDAFKAAKAELVSLTAADVRGQILRRLPYFWAGRVLPRRWRPSSTLYLSQLYDRILFHGALVGSLPARPHLAIVATNLTEGGLTVFSQDGVRTYSQRSKSASHQDIGLTRLSVATAASSAVPVIFPPLLLTEDEVGAPDTRYRQVMSDGGVTDNLGLSTTQLILGDSTVQVLCSDAGRSLIPPGEETYGLLRIAFRASDLMQHRIRDMELSRARGLQNVTMVSISQHVDHPDGAARAVQEQLEYLRTDLDAFSEAERRELVRHGYCCMAQAAADPAAGADLRFAPPAASGSIETVARSLRNGSARRIWSSLLSPTDWISPINAVLAVALAASALVLAPMAWTRALRTYHEFRFPAHEPFTGPALPAAEVAVLTRGSNAGISIERDDRVWDLRALHRKGTEVVGRALMTRSTTLRRSDAAEQFAYWFETSGRTFLARVPGESVPVTLRTQPNPILNNASPVRPWELTFHLAGQPTNESLVVRAQVESHDGFRRLANWWIGLTVAEDVATASVRIIFPRELPFKNPVFKRYQVGRSNDADAFDGDVLTALDERELVWTVDQPVKGWVYRVEWFW
jgi:predicted acylesterase/phospholipase RssA